MAEGGQASDVLIALLLQKLMERWGGGQVAEPPRAAVDVEALRKGLDAISARLESLGDLDLHEVASALRELAVALPEVDPDASERMLAVIRSEEHTSELQSRE